MTDIVMEAQVQSTTCPEKGCIRPAPHEGVRHRFAPTKDLKPDEPTPAVEPNPQEMAPEMKASAVGAIHQLDPTKRRPFGGPVEDRPINHALSTVDDGLQVAWDHCYRCKIHITQCACKEGPMEPTYITSWRTKDFPVNKQAKDLPQAVQAAAAPEPSDDDRDHAETVPGEPAYDDSFAARVEADDAQRGAPLTEQRGAPLTELEADTAEADAIMGTTAEGTHFCTACLAELYLQDSPDGPRAFTVDGDVNECPDSDLGFHLAQAHDDHPDVDEAAPVALATDDPAYDEAAQQEAESTPVETSSTIDPEGGF